jgi:hypothetical protein
MGVHYHVFMGATHTIPMATAKIEDYDESIRKFLKLARDVYGRSEHFKVGLDYQNLLKVSDFGENPRPMTIGTDALCVQWAPCRTPCMSPNWN